MTWLDTPGDFDAHTLAEFIEGELLMSDDDYLSASEVRSLFPAGRQPTEVHFEDVFSEIERRGETFGRLYPYVAHEGGVLIDRAAYSNVYAALLLLSLKGTQVRVDGDYARSDPVFDAIACAAFRNAFGTTTKAIVFAWPPRDGRPSKFPEAVGWVATQMGVALRGGPIPDELQDGGVDVIAWSPYPDHRNGFLMLVAQNTVQFAFRAKPRDVQPSRWRDWLDIGVQPTVGFAVPFVIPAGDIWWEQVSTDVHLVLDRGRLLHELAGEDPSAWPDWPQITAFVEDEVSACRQVGGTGTSVPRRRKTRPTT